MGVLVIQIEGGKLADRLRIFPGKTLSNAHTPFTVEVDVGDVVHVFGYGYRGLRQGIDSPFAAHTHLKRKDAFLQFVAPVRHIEHRHLADVECNTLGLDVFLVDQPRLPGACMDMW